MKIFTLTGFPLASASTLLRSAWSGGWAGGGAKFERLHDGLCAGGCATAGGGAVPPVDSAEDDSDSESDGDDSLPELGLPPEPIGDRMLLVDS